MTEPGKRPLEGITVLELVQKGPGAFVAMMLADMGADVIKVETPARTGESGSGGSASAADTHAQAVNMINRGKRSIVLDLKDKEAQEILHRLAASAAVLIEGFRPGVTQRLRADYETLHAINRGLVYCSLSGYGQSGPYRDLPGHDINYIGTAGVLDLIGERGRAPVVPPNLIADYGGAAMHAVAGIMLALFVRERTGAGQAVDISYLDATVGLMTPIAPVREWVNKGRETVRGQGTLAGHFPYYGVYECQDARSITIGCVEPWLWKNLCIAVGRPDLAEAGMEQGPTPGIESQRQAWCRSELEKLFKTRDRDTWFDLLSAANVCVGKVQSVAEMFQDPHLRAREMVVPLQHPEAGEVLHLGVAIKLSETPGRISGFAPWKGEHADLILSELGYDGEQIAGLHQRGVI